MQPVTLPRSPPYHMIATDVDGTLLSSHSQVSDFTKQTLQRVVAAYPYQVVVVLASGRHVLDLMHILSFMELPQHCGYIVSSNGACIHRVHYTNVANEATISSQPNKPDNKLQDVYHAFLPPQQARKLLTYISEEDEQVNVNIYDIDGWKCSLDWQDQLSFNTMSCFRYSLLCPHERAAQYDKYIEATKAAANETKDKYTSKEDSVDNNNNANADCKKANDTNCQINNKTQTEQLSKMSNDQSVVINIGDEQINKLNDDSSLPINPLSCICKIYFGSENTQRLLQLRQQIKTDMPDLQLTCSSKYCLQITAAGVTKASGLCKLLPIIQNEYVQKMQLIHHNAAKDGSVNNKIPNSQNCHELEANTVTSPWTMQQCIAFGDGQNDQIMLRAVGKGCMMGNSDPVLRDHLPDLQVIGKNTEDGVARKILEVFHLS